MTNSRRLRDNAVMTSSTISSSKYSCEGSPLKLAKGDQAMDALSGSAKLRDWHSRRVIAGQRPAQPR
jgi:hypothetical protein